MVNVSEALEIDKILEYSDFDELAQRTIIAADGFGSYDEILTLGVSDIVNSDKGFSDRTVAAGKIRFGLRWNNLLKVTINWDQDFRRISQTPSLIVISNAARFRAAIEAARQIARTRNPSGWEDSDTYNQNLGVSLRDLAACGVLPGVVTYLPIRIT